MASMGMLGAVSGAAGGFSKVMMADMEEARATRLENLRTQNNRETNTMNNTQRHEQAMTQQAQGQEFSLAELAARGEQDVAKLDKQAAIKKAEQPSYTDEYDDSGKLTGQRESGTNKWQAAGTSSTKTNIKSPDKLVIAKQLQEWGVDSDKITNFVTGDKSRSEVKRELTMELAGDSMIDAEDVPSRVEAMMQLMYPPTEGAPDAAQAGGGRSYADMFSTLKEKNAGKYSDEQIQAYLKQKYGMEPE